jgi:hypothetical protein
VSTPLPLTPHTENKYSPQSKNLPSIIRGFKAAVTVNARKIHKDFGWQSRYYDRIIRDHQEYERIESYIIQNPFNWEKGKLYSP